MPISNQLMRSRVVTNNFSRKILKLKIFKSKENVFWTVHCVSKIMVFLVLMLHYFLSTCLVLYVLKFLWPDVAYIEKSCNVLLLISDYFRNLPYYLDQVMLKQTLVLKNPQLSIFSLELKWSSCP